jgi:hypothetical protein
VMVRMERRREWSFMEASLRGGECAAELAAAPRERTGPVMMVFELG